MKSKKSKKGKMPKHLIYFYDPLNPDPTYETYYDFFVSESFLTYIERNTKLTPLQANLAYDVFRAHWDNKDDRTEKEIYESLRIIGIYPKEDLHIYDIYMQNPDPEIKKHVPFYKMLKETICNRISGKPKRIKFELTDFGVKLLLGELDFCIKEEDSDSLRFKRARSAKIEAYNMIRGYQYFDKTSVDPIEPITSSEEFLIKRHIFFRELMSRNQKRIQYDEAEVVKTMHDIEYFDNIRSNGDLLPNEDDSESSDCSSDDGEELLFFPISDEETTSKFSHDIPDKDFRDEYDSTLGDDTEMSLLDFLTAIQDDLKNNEDESVNLDLKEVVKTFYDLKNEVINDNNSNIAISDLIKDLNHNENDCVSGDAAFDSTSDEELFDEKAVKKEIKSRSRKKWRKSEERKEFLIQKRRDRKKQEKVPYLPKLNRVKRKLRRIRAGTYRPARPPERSTSDVIFVLKDYITRLCCFVEDLKLIAYNYIGGFYPDSIQMANELDAEILNLPFSSHSSYS